MLEKQCKNVKNIPKPSPKLNTGFNEILRELSTPSDAVPLYLRCKSVISPFQVRSSIRLKSEGGAKA